MAKIILVEFPTILDTLYPMKIVAGLYSGENDFPCCLPGGGETEGEDKR